MELAFLIYLDPVAGSMTFQMLISGVLSATMLAGRYLYRLVRWRRREK
jgi:hypothetical protein